MAADSKTFELNVRGLFKTDARKTLIEDFLKLLMYQKQMIPIQYDLFKRDAEQKISRASAEADNSKASKLRGKPSAFLSEKKSTQFIESVTKTNELLDRVFIYGGPVKQIVFLIGGSVTTCKESYSVIFPLEYCEGAALSPKHCQRSIFRHMVTSSIFTDNKTAGDIHIFLQAPHVCPESLKHFNPKPRFQRPTRGNHYTWKYTSKFEPDDHDLSGMEDTEFNMSGIKAHSSETTDSDSQFHSAASSESLDMETSQTDISKQTSSSEKIDPTREEYYMWYQLPVQIKRIK